jgi:chromosomal replication initiator protein
VQDELERTWPEIQAHLRRAVPDAVYQIWFEPLQPQDLADTTLVLAAPDQAVRWLADRFARVLQTCAAAVLGPDTSVDVVPASQAHGQRRGGPGAPTGGGRGWEGGAPGGVSGPGRRRGHSPSPTPAPTAPDQALNPRYTFDQFVIGEGNRLAHAAALAVAEQPGQAYNPLFVYGPPGVGKTHLLHSIAAYVQAHGGGLTTRYTTAEAFTNAFVNALQTGNVDRFKAAHRGVDVLLVDDVQFLADKARTEEEFFHTFNALHDAGRQLVLSCDRLPRDMEALEARLLERFESGLVTDVAAPDFNTRLTILRKRAHHDGLGDVDPRALEVIAERVCDNVRALEGALIRVVAYHSLRYADEPISPDLVAHVLDRLYPETRPARRATVSEVQDRICEEFGLTRDDLTSPSRAARVAWPRQLAMYLARELTDATLPAIGREFGGRDHATVLYAWRRAGERLAADRDAYERAQSLARRVNVDRGE